MDRYFGAMALPRILLALGWCVLMHGHACAHSDPAGDTSPMIDVADEKFIVTFRTRLPNQGARDEYVYSRIIYSPDGKILVPRHRLEKWPDEVYLSNPDRRDREDRGISISPAGKVSRFVMTRSGPNGPRVEVPLPLAPQQDARIESENFTAPTVGFTWTNWTSIPGFPDHLIQQLHLSHVDVEGGHSGSSVRLGEPATIESFLTASSPVWAGGKWWVAWVRAAESSEDRKNPLKTWQTVLSSFNPTTQELKHSVTTELSNWNTSAELKTTGGWLCAAWHASKDGSYPGEGKICTAFIKATAP
jgi:hypothetical protein